MPIQDPIAVNTCRQILRENFVSDTQTLSNFEVEGNSFGMTPAWNVAGSLAVNMGTTAFARYSLLSRQMFTLPVRAIISVQFSQRIANNTFIMELVSVDPTTGRPDELNRAQLQLLGSDISTQYRGVWQGQGCTVVTGAAASGSESVAAVAAYEIEADVEDVSFASRGANGNSSRAGTVYRQDNCPDPNAVYKLRLRWTNASTPPASATTVTVRQLTCMDMTEVTADLVTARGEGSSGRSLPVNVPSGVSPINMSQYYSDSTTALGAGATFTGTGRDVGTTSTTVQFANFCATAFADQAGTLIIDISNDNTTYRQIGEAAVVAGKGAFLSIPVTARYYRVRFVNGGVAQGAFHISSAYRKGD